MKDIEGKLRVYRALGDPVRLRIIEYLLRKGACTCICELSRLLKKDRSVVSRHILLLREAGIVHAYKDERYLMCCIRDRKKMRELLEV